MSRGEGGDKMVFKCPDGTFRRIGPVVIGRGKLDSRGEGRERKNCRSSPDVSLSVMSSVTACPHWEKKRNARRNAPTYEPACRLGIGSTWIYPWNLNTSTYSCPVRDWRGKRPVRSAEVKSRRDRAKAQGMVGERSSGSKEMGDSAGITARREGGGVRLRDRCPCLTRSRCPAEVARDWGGVLVRILTVRRGKDEK